MLRKRIILLAPLLALFAFIATTEQPAEAQLPGSATRSATDTTPPDTSITGGPAAGSTDTDGSVTFTYTGRDNVAVGGFDHRLITPSNPNPSWVWAAQNGQARSVTYNNLANGSYTFEVRAYDTSDEFNPNQDPTPARRQFNVAISGGGSWTSCSNTGKHVYPGQDIDAIINNDPSGTATRFCVHAGTYQVSEVARLRAGDKLDAQPGTTNFVQKCATPSGPCVNTEAIQPIPVVKLVGSGPDSLLRPEGRDISITWVDLSGARGTGSGSGAIAAGSAGSDFLLQFARIHDNDSLGISNMKGTVLDSEFFSNSEASAAIGFNASAVKGITEYEAGRLFVHDEQGNGLWCDVGCSNDPDRGAKGFNVYKSVVVNNARAGIRYENSPSTAWFENNEVHANGSNATRGGIDIRDSQNTTVIDNVFGGATFRFISLETNNPVTVTYPANNERIGIRATDSGRSDRVNLFNVDVLSNDMNGERIITCGGPVECSGNTEVGTK